MDYCSKDLINDLPDNLLCQILSNLSTKEAALTSVLSKRWRYLFALAPNLDFDDFSSQHPEVIFPDQQRFIDFVERVLTLSKKNHVNKFSLKCGRGDAKWNACNWIYDVVRRDVSDLDLHHSPVWEYSLPAVTFSSVSLVRLRIETEGGLRISLRHIDVCLPKLKNLYLDTVRFKEDEIGFGKLLSGCPVLEELVLFNLAWDYWESCSVAITSLKRLTLYSADVNQFPKSVALDTSNVVFLEYVDTIAGKYPKVNFESLLEANISIWMTFDQKANAAYTWDEEEEREMVGNATNLLMGICNVKTLYLSHGTLEILTFFCEEIPVFKNLTHLTIESNREAGWESLPNLFNNSPNLETLFFLQGLLHKATYRCGDVCLCKGLEISPCLSSSPVKFLKIVKFGETGDDEDMEKQVEQVKSFLETMPNLEQLIIYYHTSIDDALVELSSQLQMLPEVASLE